MSIHPGVKQIDAEVVKNLPSTQETHPRVEESEETEYVFCGHGPQVAALTRLAAKGSDPVPLGQVAQGAPDTKYLPAEHGEHWMKVTPASKESDSMVGAVLPW